MKYKLLTEKGTHFVCLEDGTRIPFQITTKIEQNTRETATALVSCYSDEQVGSPRIDVKDGALYLGETLMDDLLSFRVTESPFIDEMREIEFWCFVELVDTVEQPKPYKL